MKKHSNIPIFIPELACPHQCVFCDQQKISGTHSIPGPDDVKDIVERHLKTIPENRIISIAFFGGSFTGLPVDLMEQYLKEAFMYVKSGRVSGIRLSTRPDYINKSVLELLKKYRVTTIELGIQSTNREVLQRSGRGHTVDHIKDASYLISKYGFELGLQMMIGLPGDNYERSIQTASDIVSLGAVNTRIYPAIVIKGTTLEKFYHEGEYTPLTLKQAVEWTKDIVQIFETGNIAIIRMGLHPSEELITGKSLIAGPFHASFKEMVMTQIWKEILDTELNKFNTRKVKITVSNKQIHYAIGYRQANRELLNSRGYNVRFVSNPGFSKYQINVCNN
ncbi:histone acetyltransferase [Candidatus Scalindua japonica]|uniref:Histone acetyltransferase n=1 Tax=Candidatus Scalindua japonica TaxID=1284222 RepID=A0A286TUI5_9BACT|nr:radical SAM protein [Candidatus Scalindua japonica]GAX59562.1 histone acetyltransferase [Candidatus Scalindua japonica]